MEIDGVIFEEDGNSINVVGFTGDNLECEGCGVKTKSLFETEDSVMLCRECFEGCAEEV